MFNKYKGNIYLNNGTCKSQPPLTLNEYQLNIEMISNRNNNIFFFLGSTETETENIQKINSSN